MKGLPMNKQRKLKKELRSSYRFQQNFRPDTIRELLVGLQKHESFVEIATLEAGMVRLDAVIFWDKGKNRLGYDLMVKDTEDSREWICYDSLPDEVKCFGGNLEREMFRVLDRAVEQFGLSYTECPFPRLDGKPPKP